MYVNNTDLVIFFTMGGTYCDLKTISYFYIGSEDRYTEIPTSAYIHFCNKDGKNLLSSILHGWYSIHEIELIKK